MAKRMNTDFAPKTNTYVLEVVLSDVKKDVALEIAEMIQETIMFDYDDRVGHILVTAAHVKRSYFSEPQ